MNCPPLLELFGTDSLSAGRSCTKVRKSSIAGVVEDVVNLNPYYSLFQHVQRLYQRRGTLVPEKKLSSCD